MADCGIGAATGGAVGGWEGVGLPVWGACSRLTPTNQHNMNTSWYLVPARTFVWPTTPWYVSLAA